MGKKELYNTKFLTDKALLLSKHLVIEGCQNYLKEEINRKTLAKIRRILSYLNDISGTIKQLEQDQVLDDIPLFQIKEFSIACSKIRSYLFDIDKFTKKNSFVQLVLPDLSKVISILDPEGLLLSQFYIYNAYSKELAQKRKEWEKAKKEKNEEEITSLYLECQAIEDKIRERLSKELKEYIDDLNLSIKIIGNIDMYFALAEYFTNNVFTKPLFSKNNDKIAYKELSYPPLERQLSTKKKKYQPIDITLSKTPCLVTGANMAGKTILLKSLALSQYLLQFGFFVPAKKAEVVLVENILTSIGDYQNEQQGLSSYASEILILNDIIQKIRSGKEYLVLVDELARTTNPTEGAALVNSFLNIMLKGNSFSITTTHYSGIRAECYRLRVKGFIPKKTKEKLSLKDIPNQIDYSLIEDKEEKIPNEALNLAELLAVDKEFIEKAREFIK